MASKDKTKSPDIARWQELAAAELRAKPLDSLDWPEYVAAAAVAASVQEARDVADHPGADPGC